MTIDKILSGDVLAAARLMRGIDDEVPAALEELQEIYLHTGRANIVGISGAPGAGKSTLLGCLIAAFRRQDKKVGVVAVDPTSPFSGGAILGDRIRMQAGVDQDVFIRSLASRGWKGGLSKATINTIHVMDAMGKDLVFVEAVGSGQGEIDIARVADTAILVLTPGMGDEVQIMKAGILEAADIFVINKAEREGADSLKVSLDVMVDGRSHIRGDWRPPIVLTEAVCDKGTDVVAAEIAHHQDFLKTSGELDKRRADRARLELLWSIENLMQAYLERMEPGYMARLVAELVGRRTNPRAAAREIIARLGVTGDAAY